MLWKIWKSDLFFRIITLWEIVCVSVTYLFMSELQNNSSEFVWRGLQTSCWDELPGSWQEFSLNNTNTFIWKNSHKSLKKKKSHWGRMKKSGTVWDTCHKDLNPQVCLCAALLRVRAPVPPGPQPSGEEGYGVHQLSSWWTTVWSKQLSCFAMELPNRKGGWLW